MHRNQRPDCLLTGGDGASNAVWSMHGMARAVQEPGAEQRRCRSIGQVSRRVEWSGLKLEYHNVLELLENCKINVFTAQGSLGCIISSPLGYWLSLVNRSRCVSPGILCVGAVHVGAQVRRSRSLCACGRATGMPLFTGLPGMHCKSVRAGRASLRCYVTVFRVHGAASDA